MMDHFRLSAPVLTPGPLPLLPESRALRLDARQGAYGRDHIVGDVGARSAKTWKPGFLFPIIIILGSKIPSAGETLPSVAAVKVNPTAAP